MNLRHDTRGEAGAAAVGVWVVALLAGLGLLLWWTLILRAEQSAPPGLVGFCHDSRAWVATPDGAEVLRDYERDARCGPPSATDEPASELA